MRKCLRAAAILLLLAAIGAGCAGCGKEKAGDVKVYYLNPEKTGLVSEDYSWKSKGTEKRIREMLKKLRSPEDSVECTPAVPSDLPVTDYQLEDGMLELYFGQDYEQLDAAADVLLRAAVVQSLTQISGVEAVRFHVGNGLLTDAAGQEIGYMRSEDFVQNTGAALNSYEKAETTLYYADSSGSRLVKKKVTLRYNSYMTLEKAIVRQLLKASEKDSVSGGCRGTIPEGTGLLSVSLKDDVCYVNLDAGFLNESDGLDPELTVYSLVDSVIAGGNCSQVQILVNGNNQLVYRGQIDLSKPLTENSELVEE